jgi:hypothetical protein
LKNSDDIDSTGDDDIDSTGDDEIDLFFKD